MNITYGRVMHRYTAGVVLHILDDKVSCKRHRKGRGFFPRGTTDRWHYLRNQLGEELPVCETCCKNLRKSNLYK